MQPIIKSRLLRLRLPLHLLHQPVHQLHRLLLTSSPHSYRHHASNSRHNPHSRLHPLHSLLRSHQPALIHHHAQNRRAFSANSIERQARHATHRSTSHALSSSTHNRGFSNSQSESSSHPRPNSTHSTPLTEKKAASERVRSLRWRGTRALHPRERGASRSRNRRSTKTGKCRKHRSTIRTSPAMKSEQKTNVRGMKRPLLLALRALHAVDIIEN